MKYLGLSCERDPRTKNATLQKKRCHGRKGISKEMTQRSEKTTHRMGKTSESHISDKGLVRIYKEHLKLNAIIKRQPNF
jgi:hypothetical protein